MAPDHSLSDSLTKLKTGQNQVRGGRNGEAMAPRLDGMPMDTACISIGSSARTTAGPFMATAGTWHIQSQECSCGLGSSWSADAAHALAADDEHDRAHSSSSRQGCTCTTPAMKASSATNETVWRKNSAITIPAESLGILLNEPREVNRRRHPRSFQACWG